MLFFLSNSLVIGTHTFKCGEVGCSNPDLYINYVISLLIELSLRRR